MSAVRLGKLKILTIGLAAAAAFDAAPARAQAGPTFTYEQVQEGEGVYKQHCQVCHGGAYDGVDQSPPLAGETFLHRWGGRRTLELFEYIQGRMPSGAPGTLSPGQTSAVLASILMRNFLTISDQPLSDDPQVLRQSVLPPPTTSLGTLAVGHEIPPPPNPVPNPLDKITPVTDAMLQNPAEGDWLTWRRNSAVSGYSPLKQINKTNIGRLRETWSWALANGVNESTPLAHDGVIFAMSAGDVVQAINGANGDFLWQYTRRLPKHAPATHKKSLSIYGDSIIIATSDAHMVALDVKTGDVKWDTPLMPADARGYRIMSGPVIAKGKAIVGTTGSAPGGNFIVAVDAVTGKEAWRFNTIPRPGEPGGDTWNGLAYEKRTGSSVWNPGSFDPETGLVFFGPSPTYDTLPLRDPINMKKGVNDALYTNATLAFDPDTGKLVWHYQHLRNDQWDLDWAFERQFFDLTVNGKRTRAVITAGKPAIFDVLDAKTGKYLFSWDRGLQNFVHKIDPKTGEKFIDRERFNLGGRVVTVCPDTEGGKEWIPDALNPETNIVFIPLNESCVNFTPTSPGERGLLTTKVRTDSRPREGSDGNFGRLDAVNAATGQPLWVHRRRAPSTTGALATAGGLVFAGYLDRRIVAFDADSGNEVWSTRLSDAPNSTPITYTAGGKQYIAVMTGSGGAHMKVFARYVPEVKLPLNRTSILTVFEVGAAP